MPLTTQELSSLATVSVPLRLNALIKSLPQTSKMPAVGRYHPSDCNMMFNEIQSKYQVNTLSDNSVENKLIQSAI